MRKLSADWIVTLEYAPLQNGVILVDKENQIVDVLPTSEGLQGVERFKGILCPGFINAHCHLELSHLTNKLPQKTGLVGFIQNVQKFRNASEEEILDAIKTAESEMIANGIVGVGDISNSNHSFSQKSLRKLRYHTFVEAFGFNPANAETIYNRSEELYKIAPQTASITPHAPYSVSKQLFELISSSNHLSPNSELRTIHNQETQEEALFFQGKTGLFLDLYKGFGLDISFFEPSGKSSLQTYLPWMGADKKLFVHNTFTTAEDLKFACSDENYWCLCPNANIYIEDALPDISLFIESGLKLVLGTDSLSSNTQLSIFAEMQTIAANFPLVDLEQMLNWACKNGAEFFNWNDLGSLKKGKKPGVNLIESVSVNGGKFFINNQSTVKKII
ncbi:amidohydrolase family protein [Solitalea lacus]|uniref:amidohydrolase family protein n=1 Tax=Solitalea lacus TaxID=2911172 RepID=UPI001EDA8016|nr:amidohydrolase family protein [Solitalea lacus]UKJ08276.1 amidohydrolase family protein [Solitalea lacus]